MSSSTIRRDEGVQSRWVRRRSLALGAGLATAALILTACSSGGSGTTTSSSSPSSGSSSAATSSAGVALAKQAVAQWEKPPTWQGPTSPVNAKAAKGKTVDLINLTEEIPALHEWAAVAQAQLQKLGVTANICDAKGTPEGITSCLTQDIAARPNVIVAMALDTAFIHSYIQQANSAGIKVVTAQTGTPGVPQGTGAVAEVTFDYPQVGKILGTWFAADSGCKGYPQIITTTSSRQPSAAEVAGIQSAIQQYCPSSTPLPVQNVLIPDWATNLPTVTRSALTANSSLNYLLPLYDGMSIYMVPAIEQLNLSHPVQVGSFNATPVVMQNELAKKSPLSADVGGPNDWYSYALTDEILRVLVGAPVVANEHVPLRLFTRDNLSTINLQANESTWYGAVNFACQYDKLWGASCG
ncbi:MAG TPA: substrate-binding domain-containing protein [Streptosporangiaceae bacterium]|nr:substrate-binding domain-containing protein [Streptosporangiaceae bacterium]